MSENFRFPDDFLPLFISEGSSDRAYGSERDPWEWPEEEITAIRAALKKISTTRIPNANDAEDLVQETLLTMIAKCPRTALQKSPLVWSLGVLRRKVGNYYRKAKRYSAREDSEPDPERITHPHNQASPEIDIYRHELQNIVEETLTRLPEGQRQAMEMLLSGLDPGEIVSRLHPERYQNVINRLYRGRQRLARELAKYGYGPTNSSSLRKMRRSPGRKPT